MKRLVVLIPTYNVATTISRSISGCLLDRHVQLIVVVDGGSTDGTVDIARAAATGSVGQGGSGSVVVVEANITGRANCLNFAARVAAERLEPSGDDEGLVFLHADTVLPSGFGDEIMRTLADARVACGAFRIYTRGVRDGPTFLIRLVGRIANGLNNWRSSWMETPYGDQGLFCRRSVFEATGGYPCVPLMEDSAFVWEARKHGTIPLLEPCVQSFASPQWAAFGALYVMRNYLFLCAWLLGLLSPERLHLFYYPGRQLPASVPYRDLHSSVGHIQVRSQRQSRHRTRRPRASPNKASSDMLLAAPSPARPRRNNSARSLAGSFSGSMPPSMAPSAATSGRSSPATTDSALS